MEKGGKGQRNVGQGTKWNLEMNGKHEGWVCPQIQLPVNHSSDMNAIQQQHTHSK